LSAARRLPSSWNGVSFDGRPTFTPWPLGCGHAGLGALADQLRRWSGCPHHRCTAKQGAALLQPCKGVPILYGFLNKSIQN
jgi:DNA invertase Pin-like site-specific DNA recombinase